MSHKKIYLLLLLCFALSAQASSQVDNKFRYPFYLGALGGYGSTTWGDLVPKDITNSAMNMSTPIKVSEGGAVWGLFSGYELIPNFALEASYMQYPKATIYFDPESLFALNNDDRITLNTHTETVTLLGKFMVIIPNTTIRAFSSIGAGMIHRYDAIQNLWRLTPTFGGGVNYNITDHLMGEIGGTYVAGNGESELDPAEDFIPFLYSVSVRLAYRI